MAMNEPLVDYFRLPDNTFRPASSGTGSGRNGFFRFNSRVVCYGQCGSGVAERIDGSELPDASKGVRLVESDARLPFDVSQVIDNLRLERYAKKRAPGKQRFVNNPSVREAYYFARELMPVSVRRHAEQRLHVDLLVLPAAPGHGRHPRRQQ